MEVVRFAQALTRPCPASRFGPQSQTSDARGKRDCPSDLEPRLGPAWGVWCPGAVRSFGKQFGLPGWPRILALCLVLGLAACGSEHKEKAATANRPTSAPASEANAGAAASERQSEGEQEPSAAPNPARIFRNTLAPRDPWFQKLAQLVEAPPATWPKEALAGAVEEGWRGWLQARLIAWPPGFAAASSMQAQAQCLPALWTTLFDAQGIVVREGNQFGEEQTLASADWQATLGPLRTVLDALPKASYEVQVRGVEREGSGAYRLHVWLRAAQGTRSLEWESSQVWEGEPGQGTLTLLELRWLNCRESTSDRAFFADRTRNLLPPERFPDEALWSGGVEMVERHDRLLSIPTIYLGDVNGDEREDLYMARMGGVANHLWIQQPDGSLVDEAFARGVADLEDTGGVLVCDMDGDGARDLVAGLDNQVVISWNDGQGNFSKRSILNQGPRAAQIYSLSAADADGDGDLDLYDTRYFAGGRLGSAPTPYHDANNGAPNSFWRNEGGRRFAEATREMGFDHNNLRFSLASLWEDLDGDGDLDLYVSNDFGRNNFYRNEGGRFTDVADQQGALDIAASMGVSAADTNQDGRIDLYVTNMHTAAGMRVVADPRFQAGQPDAVRASYAHHTSGNTLLLNQGEGRFRSAKAELNASPGGWAWGSVFLDFNNDGLLDLFVPNGFATGRQRTDLASFFWREVVAQSPGEWAQSVPYLQAWQAITTLAIEDGYSWNGNERNYAYLNVGGARFVDVSGVSGLDLPEDGRGAALTDWDGDGRCDIWLANRSSPIVRFFHNQTENPSHWIGLELIGQAPNPEAVGALVTVTYAGGSSATRVYAGDAFLSAGSKRRLIGLGPHSEPVRVEVTWPDGEIERVESLPADAWYRWRRGKAPTQFRPQAAILQAPPAPLNEDRRGRPNERILPLDRLPLGAWDLPNYTGPRPRIEQLGQGPKLLVVYGSWPGGGREALSQIPTGEQAPELTSWIVSLDSPRHDQAVRADLQRQGWLTQAGRGGRRIRNLIETVLGEVAGPAFDRPLPQAYLFDRRGQLAAIYLGAVPTERILADARLLAAEVLPPLDPALDTLAHGRWLFARPPRSLEGLAQFLRRGGEKALARCLETEFAARAKQD